MAHSSAKFTRGSLALLGSLLLLAFSPQVPFYLDFMAAGLIGLGASTMEVNNRLLWVVTFSSASLLISFRHEYLDLLRAGGSTPATIEEGGGVGPPVPGPIDPVRQRAFRDLAQDQGKMNSQPAGGGGLGDSESSEAGD